MTRQELLAEYDVRDGVIRSPGKFEGEALYVPYFWEFGLQGFSDSEDDDGNWVFSVSDEDRQEFPELAEQGITRITLSESDSGFVYCEAL